MEKLVNFIQALTTDKSDDIKQLLGTLQKSEEMISKNVNLIDEALVMLEPKVHSLGWCYLLAGKARSVNDKNIFIQQVVQFLQYCNVGQIRLAPKQFRLITQKFTDILVDSKDTLRGIEPLRQAIAKIAPTSTHLTPQHWMLTQCCILSKGYNFATQTLDQDSFQIDPEATALESKDVRLYYYYGGICYLGLKRFRDAIEFFKVVISAPAIVPSAIMVEAYKKYVLASLLAFGQVDQVPRFTTTALLRHLKQLCAAYDELATAYSTHSTDELHKCAESNHEVFGKDSNMGLVKQVVQSLYRRNIQRLTKTYLTLSLDDITKNVKLPNKEEAERYVLTAIEKGEIFASISQKDGMVSFNENPEQYDTNVTLNNLDRRLHRTMELSETLQNVDETITSSPKYIEKTLVGERGGGGGGGARGGFPGGPGGDFDDMDVMDRGGPGGFGSMRG